MILRTTLPLLALLAVAVVSPARAAVVVNEIFYNAPDDLDDVQWVELHNTADQPVDLGGWSLGKGLSYTFPKGTIVPAKGFVVIAHKPARFKLFYRENALGPFEKPLGRGGGRIELLDAAGKTVDAVQYKDKAPWPISADGYAASLERICPTAPGDVPENWAGSPLPTSTPRPAGTPGKPNAAFSAEVPPTVAALIQTPEDPAPDQPLRVQAEVKARDGVKEVTLAYRVVTRSIEGPELTVPMAPDSSGPGRYAGEIPAQKAGTIVRYRVRAVAHGGAQRTFPAEHDLRPTLSTYIHDKWEPARIPFAQAFNIRAPRAVGLGRLFGGGDSAPPQPRGYGDADPPKPPRGSGAFVYVDTKTGQTTLYDYVNLVPRPNDRGYKVHFHKDRPLNGMTTVSIVFEGVERFLMAEALAYDVYRRAGNAAPLADFVRLWVDGRPQGYHLMIENPNRAFLRRNKVDDGGNLYKLQWRGSGLVGTHEKRTNRHSGHDDLVTVVEKLRTTSGDAQWQVIQENFDVPQVATYFAVNMVLSHWDGYFNNHFSYHDPKSGKWQMYPWDQDKTWGFYDSVPPGTVFTDMPLTFAMEGDRSPGGAGGAFGGGNANWWRRGGYFSRPLLANPQFRKVFLKRVREILDTVYTPEIYFPLIDEMADRLKDEVKIRAKVAWGDVNGAPAQLAESVQWFRTHLTERRKFLLAQPELSAPGGADGAGRAR